MIVIYHPGYMPGQEYNQLSPNEVDFLDGDPAICDDLVRRWERVEEDFYVVATCSNRDEAMKIVHQQGLHCRSSL